MFKNTLKGVGVIFGLIFLISCASKGIEVRRYVEIKDRVDQNMEGNAGYISGEPQPEDRSQYRPTRKIYVLEISQGDVEEETIIDTVDETNMNDDSTFMEYSDYDSDNFIEVSRDTASIPYIDDDVEDLEPSASFTEYTIKKDDTLQKISKKFYDSFSKWPKIYEVNKDVIDNPDSIKPGIVIQIPME